MKSKRLLFAGFVAVGTVALGSQDVTLIQRSLVENSVDTYKISSKVVQTLNSPQIGEMPLNITSGITYTLKTLKVDTAKGSADVQATTTVDSIDGGDSLIGSRLTGQKPGPVVQNGKIDKFGHLTLDSPTSGDPIVTAVMGASGSMQSTLFIELPDHAVKVGDTWDVIIPKSLYTGDADQKLTAKLTGEKKVDGKDVWTVDLTGTINIQFDSAKLPQTGTESTNPLGKTHILVKGSTDVNGTGDVDKATGKTIDLTSTGTIKSKMELPDQGDMTADITGTLGTEVKLKS